MSLANYLLEREQGLLPSDIEYCLKDDDDDWWVSDCGDLFTLVNNPRPDTFHLSREFAELPLDTVIHEHGVVDDGVTDKYADFTAHVAEPLRTIEGGGYTTKDSGERAVFDSGMQRDSETGKPRFDLLIPDDVAYEDQFLTRVAMLMARGAEKYEDRNWEKADSEKELRRMKSSAFRHFMQWFCGEQDEDHAAATVFNLLAHTTIKHKIDNANVAQQTVKA